MGNRPAIIAVVVAAFGAVVATTRPTQQAAVGEVTITPASDLRALWLDPVAESPNGRFVLLNRGGDTLDRYDRVTKQWASSVTRLGQQPKWSPDGRFVAFARFGPGGLAGRSVWIVPMDTATGLPNGTARRISTRSGSWPVWSPDSRRIAMSVQDSGRFRVVVAPFNGGDDEVLYDAQGGGGDLAWSPDGKYVWAAHGLGPQSNGPQHYLRINVASRHADSLAFGLVRMLGYSRDGSRVAHFDGPSRTLIVTSASDGRQLQRVRIPRTMVPLGWSKTTPNAFSAIERVTPGRMNRVAFSGGPIQPISPIDSAGFGGNPQFSQSGAQFAFISHPRSRDQINVADANGSNARAVGTPGDISVFKWSPTGTRLAYLTRGTPTTIHVIDVATGSDRELVRPAALPAESVWDIAWRSDGATIRYLWAPKGQFASERELHEVTLDGKDRLLAAGPAVPSEPHFINDTLMLLRKQTGVDAVDIRTGAVRTLYKGTIRGRNDFGLSADGKWIVVSADANGENQVPRLISLTTGESRAIPYALGGELGVVYFHPDGRNLVTTACLTCTTAAGYFEKWDVVVIPMNGDPARVLTAGAKYADTGGPAISPDGKYILFEADLSYNTRIVTLTLPKAP